MTHTNLSLIYIAGYGRSGSTLVDLLLNTHDDIIGIGELLHLFKYNPLNIPCSCGMSVASCSFWKSVIDIRPMYTANYTAPRHIHYIHHTHCDTLHCLKHILHNISYLSGKSVIVDSSKTATVKSIRHLLMIQRIFGSQLKVLHLVRDPRAVMWSIMRGSNKKLLAGKSEKVWGAPYRAVFGWYRANLLTHIIKRTHPHLQIIRMRYEDIVHKPIQEISKLGLFLDLDMSQLIKIVQNGNPIHGGHAIAGNRMRHHGPIKLTADFEWQVKMPKTTKSLAWASWPLSARYGYNVFSS